MLKVLMWLGEFPACKTCQAQQARAHQPERCRHGHRTEIGADQHVIVVIVDSEQGKLVIIGQNQLVQRSDGSTVINQAQIKQLATDFSCRTFLVSGLTLNISIDP